jgi:hypothetical protein
MNDTEKIFTDIIQQHRWLDHICGTGSTMTNTENVRKYLPEVMAKLGCISLLDAPCGDYSWMSQVKWPEGFQYIGADIVAPMIDRLKTQWPDRDFRHINIITDPLPKMDVMLCRDCLIHLPWADIRRVIQNVVDSGIGYLAATSYLHGEQNDISMGGCHHINLRANPACFPDPLYAILDQGHQILEHHIMFWSRDQLITALENWQ